MYQELRLAVLALAVAMSTAQAQEQEGKFIIGPRDFSCGKWTNTPKNTAQHDVLGSWVFGYLSGTNVENAGVDFLRGREPDELMAWIDNYCQRNPGARHHAGHKRTHQRVTVRALTGTPYQTVMSHYDCPQTRARPLQRLGLTTIVARDTATMSRHHAIRLDG